MEFLVKKNNNSLGRTEKKEEASHVMLEIDEYNSIMRQLENLKRINKERSNSERQLKQKKERSGYILLGYDTNKMRTEFEGKSYSFETRRLLLESPYDVHFDYKTALELAQEDLIRLCDGFGADICIDKNLIANEQMLKNFFSIDSEKALFVGGLEAQRNGAWAVRLYANFTPNVPIDCIKKQPNKNDKER